MAINPRAGALFAGAAFLSLLSLITYAPWSARGSQSQTTSTAATSSTAASSTATSAPASPAATTAASPAAIAATSPAATTAAGAMSFDDYVEPFESIDVLSLAKQSDLIVVGHIKQIQGPKYLEVAHHMNDPHHPICQMPIEELKAQMFYVIDCERVLKGDPLLVGKQIKWIDPNWSQNIHVDTTHGVTYGNSSKNGIPQLTYGICLLKGNGSNLVFTDKNHCILPASPTPPKASTALLVSPISAVSTVSAAVSAPNDAGVADLIVSELIHVIETPLELLDSGGGATGGESSVGPSGSYTLSKGELLIRDAVTVLTQLPPEMYKPQLARITTDSGSPISKLWAFDTLACNNDWTFFSNVQAFILAPSEKLKYAASYPFARLKERFQTSERQMVLKALPRAELTICLQSTDTNIREACSTLLAGLQDPQLAQVLLQTATSDNEETVRESALAGLRELTNINDDVWKLEPTLAREIAFGKARVNPFGPAMRKGAIFDQRLTTREVNARFANSTQNASVRPLWVAAAIASRSLPVVRDEHPELADSLSEPSMPIWSWEGSEDQHGHKMAWYTFKKKAEFVDTKNDSFVIRDSTVALLVDLRNGQYPEMSDKLELPPLKILDGWQQDDDIVLKRQSDGTARLINIRRLYDADGAPVALSPSGMKRSASMLK